MDNIITLFKLILFLETALITPVPITIDGEWVSIKPEKSLEAITGGAAIYIDVTKYLKPLEFGDESNRLADGIIEGKLIQKNGNEIALINTGESHSNESVRSIVSSSKPVPTDVEFVEVKLKSQSVFKNVNVYWKNGKH